MVTRYRKLLATLAVATAMVAFVPAASGATNPEPVLSPDDWTAPVADSPQGLDTIQGLFDDDPTGLVPKSTFVQRYSLDQDHWEVWLCGSVSATMPQVIAALEAATVDYYDSISGGVYEPVFSAGGTKPSDVNCLPEFLNGTYATVGNPEGLLIVDSATGGGYASPGTICVTSDPDCSWISTTFPGNSRYAVIGENSALNYPSVTAHELGHTLQWPHSNSGTGDEYDNPLDLMSGNLTEGGWTEPEPYATLSYNRLQSGWVSTGDVVVADGGHQSMTLVPHDVAGTQLFAIETAQAGRFYVFGARVTSAYDPIPAAWQGVEVYFVDYYCSDVAFGGGICPGIYRDQTQQPPSPDGVGHVLQPGESIDLEGITVTVTGATATGYAITADPSGGTVPGAPGTPTVTVTAVGEATTSWSAPPDDGGFAITGYELALDNETGGGTVTHDPGSATTYDLTGLDSTDTYRYRVRAENSEGWGAWSAWSPDFIPGLVPAAPGVPVLTPSDGEITAGWDAAAVIGSPVDTYDYELENGTLGASITGTTAAATYTFTGLVNGDDYRVRVRAHNASGWGPWSAWSQTATPHEPDSFVDDDGSIFEADIEWLAEQGITKGCNPPDNDMFCPNSAVTRGQMAAFLVRALGLTAQLTDPFIDDDGSVFEADIEKLAAAGITMGCNPPVNDMFCPNSAVTRGQMAAFLVRALGYTDPGPGDLFIDDDSSIFEGDIDRLATAGVTMGCNPPANDMFCPSSAVTRGQMAAFLHRALTP